MKNQQPESGTADQKLGGGVWLSPGSPGPSQAHARISRHIQRLPLRQGSAKGSVSIINDPQGREAIVRLFQEGRRHSWVVRACLQSSITVETEANAPGSDSAT